MHRHPQPLEPSWAPEGSGLGPYHPPRTPQQANPDRTAPPQAHTTDDAQPAVLVPLPGTDAEMCAKPVPGWDEFVVSYLANKKTGTSSSHGPIIKYEYQCPDDIIRPKHAFGDMQQQQQHPLPATCTPTGSRRLRPQVLVYAPGCTPGPAAAGVDPMGVWYDAPHDVCPVRSVHRHNWSGGVYFPDYYCHSHSRSYRIDTAYETVRAWDQHLLEVDTRCAEVAARYLAALRRVGITPGPLLYVFSVPSAQSCDGEPCGGGGGGGMWRPHVPTPLASFASVVKGSGLLLPFDSASSTGTTGTKVGVLEGEIMSARLVGRLDRGRN